MLETLKEILRNLSSSSLNGLRAICVIVVSKFGDGPKRRLIRNHYSIEPSAYVKEAILFSVKFFPSAADRRACIKSWEMHSDINSLIAIAIRSNNQEQEPDAELPH